MFGPPPKDHVTGKLPQHGFARNSRWEYLGKSSSESGALAKGGDDSITLDFGLSRNSLSEDAKAAWQYEFALVYSVTLGKDSLQTMLNVRNEGKEPFEFQMLLHSYFKVDVSRNCTMTARRPETDSPCTGHLQDRDKRPRLRHLRRQDAQRHRAGPERPRHPNQR